MVLRNIVFRNLKITFKRVFKYGIFFDHDCCINLTNEYYAIKLTKF